MNIIEPGSYDENVATLRKDPIVIGMAHSMRNDPLSDIDLTKPDGGLGTSFMTVANEEYRRRGGDFSGPLQVGAVGRAVISLLANRLSPQELYEDWTDDFLQLTIDRVARRMQQDPNPPVVELHAELLAEQARRRNA